MKIRAPHKRHRSHTDDADEPEPGQGPVPDGIPADPEHDRTVDPEA